jgi:hypothetical protein
MLRVPVDDLIPGFPDLGLDRPESLGPLPLIGCRVFGNLTVPVDLLDRGAWVIAASLRDEHLPTTLRRTLDNRQGGVHRRLRLIALYRELHTTAVEGLELGGGVLLRARHQSEPFFMWY